MRAAIALSIVALVGSTAFAQTPAPSMEQQAAAFGQREAVGHASISPDGRQIALVQPYSGRGSVVRIVDLSAPDGPLKLVLKADGDPERIARCNWASNTRLLCTIYGITKLEGTYITYSSRIVAVNADGTDTTVLQHRRGSGRDQLSYSTYGGDVIDWNPGVEGSVLMMRQYVPETATGTLLAQTKDGIGVDLVDTRTLRSKIVEQPNPTSAEFITDGRGVVRIVGRRPTAGATGNLSDYVNYFYRRKDAREWEAMSTVDSSDAGFDPHGVDPDKNVAYGLMRVNGRLAAYTMALDGSKTLTQLFAHPDVDVDGFIRMGRNRRIVGASYATDVREVHYFDPELSKLSRSLAKAIPKLPLIRFVDTSEDESKLILWAGADNDPGRFYLFDRAKKSMGELIAERPQLQKTVLAEMKAVSYKATDGTMIPGYLTMPPGGPAKNLPAIVMPHGGPGARDEWGFDWLAQFFASQGYAVLQPNFRGSTGYGDAWFQNNGFQSWPVAIGDVSDGGRWLVSEGVADPKKLAIFGWSYGGYAALQSAVVSPDLFKAVIAVAPVTDLAKLKDDRRDWADHAIVSRFVGSGPHVAQGSPAARASQIKAPVLMFHGKLDRNVGVGHAQLMDGRLRDAGKSSQIVLYDGLDHYLEDSEVRADMLAKSAAFLKDNLGK